MKILNLSTVHRWNDPRILYKEASTLARKFEVIHAATGDREDRVIDDMDVRFLGKWVTRWQRPRLWWRGLKLMRQCGADVVHFHDPELALLLLPFTFLGNRKFVCDIHEHPSGAIAGREWIPRGMRSMIAGIFSTLLRITPYVYDQVILAETHYQPLFPERKNVHLILNHALIPDPDVPFIDRYRDFDPSKELRLFFIGALVEDRGALKMVEMFDKVQSRFPNATLDLIGKVWPEALDDKLKLASERSGGRIKLHGFMDFSEAGALMQKAHIGLIPLQPHPNHVVSIVTKFYDYMIYGLPSVVSNFPLWQDFIRENPIGITADPADPNKLADAVIKLAQDNDMLQRLSRTGYDLVREKFNWEKQGEKLLKIYSELE
jgi:glycosyltransferase involved in cell wall biosynthesis